MLIAFDAAKDATNIAKHGVSLAFGEAVFGDRDRLAPIDRRRGSIQGDGLVDGRLWTAVYVLRADRVRFISVRKSNDGESRFHGRA